MPEMTDFQTFAMVGGWICAGIVLLASVVKTAREGWTFIRKPTDELRGEIDEIKDKLRHHDECFGHDLTTLKLISKELVRQGEVDAQIIEGVYLIAQHIATDNHIDKIKEWTRNVASSSVAPNIAPEDIGETPE